MTLKNFTSLALASHRISQYFLIKQEIKQTIIIAPIAFAEPKNFGAGYAVFAPTSP